MIADYIYNLLPENLPLVVGELPASNDEVVGIIEFDGYQNTEFFGGKTDSSLYNPLIKIVVRNKTYSGGQQWIDIVKETLHRYHDDTLLSVLMVGNPMYLGRSPEDLHEFQVTFTIQLKE